MPVRTRSQRMAEEKEDSDSNGSAPVIESSRKSTGKQRGSRRSARLAKKQKAKEQQQEEKSEEIQEPSTTQIYDDADNDKEEFDQDEEEINANNKSNVEDFRRYVQDYLETPDRVQMPRSRIQHIIEPSPRIDAITIKNKNSKLEFLVPPRKPQETMEIREEVRNLLSPDTQPMTTQQLDPLNDKLSSKSPSKSPSLPYDQISKYGDKLRQDKTTRLWSPYTPNFDKEQADRTARLLITLMFVIVIAVFIKIYQDDIIIFLKPIVQDLKQFIIGLLYIDQDVVDQQPETELEQDFTVTR